jgi:hypothetical protein
MQFEAIGVFIIANWMALMAGILGLAMRASRVPLPNGGAEPRSIWAHGWRLFRVWIEATAGAFVLALIAAGGMIAKPDLVAAGASPFVLALFVFLGAAASDLWMRWGTDPTKAPGDIANAVGGLVDVWRRFKGDVAS